VYAPNEGYYLPDESLKKAKQAAGKQSVVF
jgi:hypothetical protein